jgi:hypothetical protein
LDDWAAEPKGQDELGLNITSIFLGINEKMKEHFKRNYYYCLKKKLLQVLFNEKSVRSKGVLIDRSLNKGTMSRDFLLNVFFMYHLPPWSIALFAYCKSNRLLIYCTKREQK